MDDNQQHQVVALLVKGGTVVRFGVNQLRYSNRMSYFDHSLHAEVDLIKKCSADELVGAKIFVYRFNNTTAPDAREPKVSAPCLLCQHMLNTAKIGKVTYIDKNNNLVCTKGRDLNMLTNHPCEITKFFAEEQRVNKAVRFEPSRYMFV